VPGFWARDRRGRGPRLGTKLALLVLALALIIVPWLSTLLLDQMGQALAQMQSQHQRLTAKSISTVFNGRDDLFADLPVEPSEYEALFAEPIANLVRLDGAAGDWGGVAQRARWFGPAGEDASFALSLGTRGSMLYAYLNVVDDSRVFRDPAFLRLDNADQVRISFIQANGEDGRIAVTLSESGATTAYRMDADWSFAAAGPPESDVEGYFRATDAGYALELRLPFSLLGARRFFGLAVVDVDDAETRAIRTATHTLPAESAADSFQLVPLRSPDLLSILEGLGYSGMHILVIDAQRRIRAETGSLRAAAAARPPRSWETRLLDWLTALRGLPSQVKDGAGPEPIDRVMDAALSGEGLAVRRSAGGTETILAGHPIVTHGASARGGGQAPGSGQPQRTAQGAVIGMIVVEQNIDDILLLQREAIDQVVMISVSSFLAVLLCLIVFAGRLTWRIRGLRREAAAAIDEYGRLRANAVASGMTARDEIGDLARSVSNMLARLGQHNAFLQRMPRTLRHEINNPLNTLNTSLEHLAQESASVRDSKYLESAKRGVLRIGAIVQNLADAANLEESLAAEELEVLDVQAIVQSYVRNCAAAHPHHAVVFRGVAEPVLARVADHLIEQMLDKLIDNAVDFHRPNSPIRVQLDVERGNVRISVANRGPVLPEDLPGSLFDSMVSRRTAENRLHFGLGLYVVRVIAETHGGTVQAVNLVDRSGVAIIVRLPLAAIAAEPAERVGAG
jgi:signal transduction histidine kinase